MSPVLLALAIALLWLFGPGLAIGLALGLRGWLLAGAAPALTFGFVGAASLVFAAVGIRWQALSVGIAVAVLAAALAVGARPWRIPIPPNGPKWGWYHHAGIGVTLIAAGVMGVRSVAAATSGLTEVNQTWDAFFQVAAARLITDTGNASPFALGPIAAQASTSFFVPDTYHATLALIYSSSGLPIVIVHNASLAVLPFVLACGVVAFFRATTGRPAHAVSGALLAVGVAAVPYHLFSAGAVVPYASALVMVAAVIGLVAVLLRSPGWRIAVALAVAASGLMSAHPQAGVLAALVAAAQFGWHVFVNRRVGWALVRAAAVSLLLSAVLNAALLRPLTSAAGGANFDWPAYTRPLGAVRDLVLFKGATIFPQWWFVPLFAIGLLAIVVRRGDRILRPLLAAIAVIGVLYVLAAAYDTPLSLKLTSIWWNDRHRLFAAFSVLAILACAVGMVLVRDVLIVVLRRFRPALLDGNRAIAVPIVVLAVVMAGFTVLSNGNYAAATQANVAEGYGGSPTLSPDEQAGLASVADIVAGGGGGLVMNDPHDGSGWAYPLYGVHLVFPTPLSEPFQWSSVGYDRNRLYDRFDELDTSPDVRAAVTGLNVRWAVVCTGLLRGPKRAPGLDHMDAVKSTRLVYSNGSVQLYRLETPAPAQP